MSRITQFAADTQLPIVVLDVGQHFKALTDKERRYAHHLSRASWHGTRIIAAQLSHDSPILYSMLLSVFKLPNGNLCDFTKLKSSSAVQDSEFTHFLEYAVQVLSNIGNFKSFGDTKFIPRLPQSSFEKIVKASNSEIAVQLFNKLKFTIYRSEPESVCHLGFPAPDDHVSGFYSDNVSKSDVEAVQKVLDTNGISALNTRLFKSKTKENTFELRVASAQRSPDELVQGNGITVNVVYGDFASEMEKIVREMEAAAEFTANDTQLAMCKSYVASFRSGDIEDHRQAQIHWVKDKGPVVESNIGFIETYRDPAGIRAEWEGFVAVVNKEMTKKFSVLVENAESFIRLLPWPSDFEKDSFLCPDFTSLEVVSFCTGGLPAGINIPNYDDIRQTVGFKNVSLGNVLNAHSPNEKVYFLSPSDTELFTRYRGPAFEVQVGLHELLGHGSGKLLAEEPAGVFNFDRKNMPRSPIDNSAVSSWYKPGQTWNSVFQGVSCSYEECRAESVAMHLMTNKKVLSIFGHEGAEADDILYVGFLSMSKAGLTALEFYDPRTDNWGQAHMQARFALLKIFIDAGLTELKFDPSSKELLLTVHRDRIITHAAPAVAKFLIALQFYKATADVIVGTKFYNDATAVSPWWHPIRDVVIEHKQPRKLFVQCNTVLSADGSVSVIEYPATLEGVIQSHVERDV